jgi:hypothetical protein
MLSITGITKRIACGYRIQTIVEHHVSKTLGHLPLHDTIRVTIAFSALTFPSHRYRLERVANVAASSSGLHSL